MDPVTGAVIAGGLGLAGSLYSNDQSAKQADKQMQFQKDMSNTAHQRQVEDLRKAGLNPILSALGSGASSPGGASANINDLGPGLSKGVETAVGIKSMNKEIDLKDQTIDNMRDESFNIVENRKKIQADTTNTKLNNDQIALQNKLLKSTLPHAIAEAKAKGDWSQVNQLMGVISTGTSSAKDAAEILSPIKLKFPKGK